MFWLILSCFSYFLVVIGCEDSTKTNVELEKHLSNSELMNTDKPVDLLTFLNKMRKRCPAILCKLVERLYFGVNRWQNVNSDLITCKQRQTVYDSFKNLEKPQITYALDTPVYNNEFLENAHSVVSNSKSIVTKKQALSSAKIHTSVDLKQTADELYQNKTLSEANSMGTSTEPRRRKHKKVKIILKKNHFKNIEEKSKSGKRRRNRQKFNKEKTLAKNKKSTKHTRNKLVKEPKYVRLITFKEKPDKHWKESKTKNNCFKNLAKSKSIHEKHKSKKINSSTNSFEIIHHENKSWKKVIGTNQNHSVNNNGRIKNYNIITD